MEIVLRILHVVASLALIMIVLLQTGKGASLGAAFGGASQTVFGARGPASFLHKLTTAMAVLFMLTSLSLAFLSSREGRTSAVVGTPPPASAPAPAPAPRSPAPSR